MLYDNEWADPRILNETLYFYSEDGYSFMKMKEKRLEVLDIPLVQIEQKLPGDKFCRVHRNYLVNVERLDALKYYRKNFFAWIGDYKVPVSRRRKKILLDSLDIL